MTDHITRALIDAGKRRSVIRESIGAEIEWSVWEAGLRLSVRYAGASVSRRVAYSRLAAHRMPTILLSEIETSAMQEAIASTKDSNE